MKSFVRSTFTSIWDVGHQSVFLLAAIQHVQYENVTLMSISTISPWFHLQKGGEIVTSSRGPASLPCEGGRRQRCATPSTPFSKMPIKYSWQECILHEGRLNTSLDTKQKNKKRILKKEEKKIAAGLDDIFHILTFLTLSTTKKKIIRTRIPQFSMS